MNPFKKGEGEGPDGEEVDEANAEEATPAGSAVPEAAATTPTGGNSAESLRGGETSPSVQLARPQVDINRPGIANAEAASAPGLGLTQGFFPQRVRMRVISHGAGIPTNTEFVDGTILYNVSPIDLATNTRPFAISSGENYWICYPMNGNPGTGFTGRAPRLTRTYRLVRVRVPNNGSVDKQKGKRKPKIRMTVKSGKKGLLLLPLQGLGRSRGERRQREEEEGGHCRYLAHLYGTCDCKSKKGKKPKKE